MLFTERKDVVSVLAAGAADAIGPSSRNGRRLVPPPGSLCSCASALLGAVARRDLLLGGILGRRVLDHRVEDRQVGLVVAGDDLPFLAVPLLDARDVGALVVLAAQLDRGHHALEAKLLDARGGQV